MSSIEAFNAVLLLAMATALILALVSQGLQNRFIASEPLLALACGVLFGPACLGWVRLEHLTPNVHTLLEQSARLTLSIAIMTATLRVGWRWTRDNLRDIVLMLALGMPIMCVLSWAAFSVSLDLAAWPALLMAAIVTPTDPVLAQAIVTSSTAEKKVPSGLRHLISVESAANDGLALPLVIVPLLALAGPGEPFWPALVRVIFWEVAGAFVLGGFFGWLIGRALMRLRERWTTETSEITVSTTLAFATLAGTKLLDMDGIFGVCGAGLGLAAALGEQAGAHHEFNDTMSRLFQLPTLTLLGLALPFDVWLQIGWPLLAAVVSILLFRRLPMVLALKPSLRTLQSWPSAIFVGWFGPVGIAALFYAMLVEDRTGIERYFGIVSAVIVGSVVAHGLTDTIGARLFGRTLGTK
jgi:NhaP-type Na+/H+ or K+/H+ antiporter